jgi:hypothetical membrane protein
MSRTGPRSRLNRLVAVLWIGAALCYVTLEAIAASAIPRYDYARDYISALGVPVRSPLAAAMNGAFLVQGIMFVSGALLVARIRDGRCRRPFLVFAAADAVGNIIVATVHSGSAPGASGWAWLHAVGAVLAIAGGNAAILTGSAYLAEFLGANRYRVASVSLAGLGVLGLTMFALIAATDAGGVAPVGIFERAGVYPILAWQVYTAIALLSGDVEFDR